MGMSGLETIFIPVRRCMDFTGAGMLSSKNAIMPTIVFALPGVHKFEAATRYFTNLFYLERMPLGFFTVSSPGESMTLSPVTLAQYYPWKIPIFDAVTLSLL